MKVSGIHNSWLITLSALQLYRFQTDRENTDMISPISTIGCLESVVNGLGIIGRLCWSWEKVSFGGVYILLCPLLLVLPSETSFFFG
jgi:hypothetical protein